MNILYSVVDINIFLFGASIGSPRKDWIHREYNQMENIIRSFLVNTVLRHTGLVWSAAAAHSSNNDFNLQLIPKVLRVLSPRSCCCTTD